MAFGKRLACGRAHLAFALIFLLATFASTHVLAAQERRAPRARVVAPRAKKVRLAPAVRAVLERISADSLRGHLSFIASDALEGRNTPSRGLDLAAEYIAAQFRRAGLEAVGDDGYFQTANWSVLERSVEEFEFDLRTRGGAHRIPVAEGDLSIPSDTSVNLERRKIIKVVYGDSAALDALKREEMTGNVVITELPNLRRVESAQRQAVMAARREFLSRLEKLGAALVLSVDKSNAKGTGLGLGRLRDPESKAETTRAMGAPSPVPIITIHNHEMIGLIYDLSQTGDLDATLSLKMPAQVERPVKVRNVVGLLRGSDPVLRDTYVIVSAHYDHIGTLPPGEGDRVYNGANDDGSGTVSVIELASAFSTLKKRPKRSILFMTFFGEEKGLLGSRYYGRRPVVPLEKTVAQVNLEVMGRTDDNEGAQLSSATLTGFDYTDMGAIFKAAGEATGVRLYKHERNSDAFFSRSDNQALADQGVPAHTLSTAFEYPDYHGLEDEWEKIDYANMEKVLRTVGLALMRIADNSQAPKWNEANPKTERYVKAWRERRGK